MLPMDQVETLRNFAFIDQLKHTLTYHRAMGRKSLADIIVIYFRTSA